MQKGQSKYNDMKHHDIHKYQQILAKFCLDTMNKKLKMNILGLPLEAVLLSYDDINPEEREGLKARLSRKLQYACRYWINHVTEMRKNDVESVREPLQYFILDKKHFLHWLEVISVIGGVSETGDALISLYNWFKVRNKCSYYTLTIKKL